MFYMLGIQALPTHCFLNYLMLQTGTCFSSHTADPDIAVHKHIQFIVFKTLRL